MDRELFNTEGDIDIKHFIDNGDMVYRLLEMVFLMVDHMDYLKLQF